MATKNEKKITNTQEVNVEVKDAHEIVTVDAAAIDAAVDTMEGNVQEDSAAVDAAVDTMEGNVQEDSADVDAASVQDSANVDAAELAVKLFNDAPAAAIWFNEKSRKAGVNNAKLRAEKIAKDSANVKMAAKTLDGKILAKFTESAATKSYPASSMYTVILINGSDITTKRINDITAYALHKAGKLKAISAADFDAIKAEVKKASTKRPRKADNKTELSQEELAAIIDDLFSDDDVDGDGNNK